MINASGLPTSRYLFVYGTLRRGSGNDTARFLARHADFVGEATCQARLYRVGDYPGAVPSADPRDRVHGEVFFLHDPEAVLCRLDEYEACGPLFPEPVEYERRVVTVRLEGGGILPAWIYFYRCSTDALVRIVSGDFYSIHR